MTTIKRATINGYVLVLTEDDGLFLLTEGNSFDDYDEPVEDEFDDRDEAIKQFEHRAEKLRDTPNWEAQAAYDEEHGTDNGYAPWQLGEY